MNLRNLSNNQTVAGLTIVVITAMVVPFCVWLFKSPVNGVERIISSTSNLLELPESELNKTKLFINKKEVNSLSRVDISLCNRTGENYENVNVSFKIDTDDKNRTVLLGKSFLGPPGYSSGSIHPINLKENLGTLSYKIDILNSSDDLTKCFKSSFIFSGKEPPKVNISATAKGMELVDYNPSKMTRSAWFFFTSGLIFYAAVGVSYYLWNSYRNKMRNRLKHERSTKALKGLLESKGLNQLSSNAELISQIVETVIKPGSQNILNKDLHGKE